MSQYLLAAEADKIQDLIFRASKLREVVGGSQLLSRFEEDDDEQSGLSLLIAKTKPAPTIISAGGGSFRLLFGDAGAARTFGQKLAELYRLTTGGSLSVAEPVPFSGDYQAASNEAEIALRRAKISGSRGQSMAHLPYAAFCASCGVALAAQFEEKYLCSICLAKGAERQTGRDHFLQPFYTAVVGEAHMARYNRPGNDPAGEVARFDARNYVAYLVADGNNMGQVFGQCNQEQAGKLSRRLTPLLCECLAGPAGRLVTRQPQLADKNFIPVLPLILGGDDLFALLPARWALDFAGQFCRAYEAGIAQTLAQLGLSPPAPPTMAAAVVICKANYPYYLAHQAGETRLKEAKRLAKLMGLETGVHSSVVNFEIIIGSQLLQPDETEQAGGVRDTLRPYWLNPAAPADYGLLLETLLAQRERLLKLPRRRHAQLRGYFEELRGLSEAEAREKEAGLALIRRRVARSPEDDQNLQAALQALGEPHSGWLRRVQTRSATWLAHGLPDLLDAWDFSCKVDQPDMAEEG